MSIDAFRLQNFMAFKDTGWIELRQINLLLGRNSSGKTAIIRALRLMKQSLLTDGNSSALEFKAEGGVDLGSFEATLHKPTNSNEKVEQITFGFRGWIGPRTGEEAQWSLVKRCLVAVAKKQAVALPFEINLGYRREKDISKLAYFQVNLMAGKDSRETEILYFAIDPSSSDFKHRGFSFENNVAQKIFKLRSSACFLPELQITEQVDDHPVRLQEQAVGLSLFWNDCKQEIDSVLKNIQYVGPIRPQPERYYAITDEMYRKWDIRGWKFFADFLNTPLDKDRYDKIRFWLDRMKLGESLVPIPHFYGDGDLPKVIELVLYEGGPNKENSRRNLKDVGYGASQIIPVIVAALTSADSALVLIEQPELHLHPEAQADIADLLIDSIKGTSRRLLVETHSEHLLLRTQRRVAETTLDQVRNDKNGSSSNEGFPLDYQNVGLIFVIRKEGNSQVEYIRVKRIGELEVLQNDKSAAPSEDFQDFFKYDYEEVVELNKTIAKIKRLEQSNDNNY